MFINIGEKIKNLRTAKGLTQDKLAQFLGVNCRDVIKWESGGGYPDLEIIPVIANYFEVTTDDLLGMELFGNEEKIKGYLERFQNFISAGKLPQAADTMREGLLYFPNNYRFKCMLMYSLYLSCDRPAAIKQYSGEIISLSEDILSSCTDDAIRLEAKRVLCMHYYEDLENAKAAREIAMSLPGRINSRESMLARVTEGEDKLALLQENISSYLEDLADTIAEYAVNDESLTAGDKIAMYELTLRLAREIYSDGDYNAYNETLTYRYIALTSLYIQRKENEKALDCLDRAADCALAFDRLPENAGYTFTSRLLNRLTGERQITDTAHKRGTRTLRDVLIGDVLPQQYLEPVRYAEKMRRICEKLAHPYVEADSVK